MFFGFVGSLSTQTSVRPRNDREKNNRRGKRGMTDKENGRMIGGQEMKSKKKKKKKKKQNKNADQKKKSYERTGKRSEARRWWDGRFSYRRWITTGQRRAPGRSALRFCFTTFRFCCSFFYRASVDVSLNLSPSSIKCESCGAGTCCCFFSIRYVWTTECRPQMVIVPRILVSKIHYTGFSKRMNEEGQLLLAPLCWWLFIRTERGLLLFCSVFFSSATQNVYRLLYPVIENVGFNDWLFPRPTRRPCPLVCFAPLICGRPPPQFWGEEKISGDLIFAGFRFALEDIRSPPRHGNQFLVSVQWTDRSGSSFFFLRRSLMFLWSPPPLEPVSFVVSPVMVLYTEFNRVFLVLLILRRDWVIPWYFLLWSVLLGYTESTVSNRCSYLVSILYVTSWFLTSLNFLTVPYGSST